MSRQRWVSVVLLLAVLAWGGVLLQLWLSLRLAAVNGKPVGGVLVAFFGYFTILTNLFVAVVASAGVGTRPGSRVPVLYRPTVVGCATTAIVLVGIVYHTLLRELWSPQGAQWLADTLLHYVVPVVALLHWWTYRAREGLGRRSPWQWCLYPLAYCLYIVVRGELLGVYPYPFIDVSLLGYARAAVHAAAILAMFVLLGFAILAVARLADRHHYPERSP